MQWGRPSTAHAYVDPNTGGYIFQLLFPALSALATIGVFCKNGIRRLMDMAWRRGPAPGGEPD